MFHFLFLHHLQPQASRPPAPPAAGPDRDVIELGEEEDAKSSALGKGGVNVHSPSSQGRRRKDVSEGGGGSQSGVNDVEDEG